MFVLKYMCVNYINSLSANKVYALPYTLQAQIFTESLNSYTLGCK